MTKIDDRELEVVTGGGENAMWKQQAAEMGINWKHWRKAISGNAIGAGRAQMFLTLMRIALKK